jgi:hypothetical protein
MTWRSEPAAATWLQVALFGCAALWFGLTSLAGFGKGRRPSLPDLFHTLMAGVRRISRAASQFCRYRP